MTSYQFRAVDLSLLGVAMGYNERGERVRVIVPCASGNRQLANVSVSVEVHANSAWSAGVMSLRMTRVTTSVPRKRVKPLWARRSRRFSRLSKAWSSSALLSSLGETI